MSADLSSAIQCLEHELGATLDRAAELSLAIRTLRDLRPASPSDVESATPAPPATAASSGPAAPAPSKRRTRTSTKSSAATPARSASSSEEPPADSAPAGGITRPASHDCAHCDKSFGTPQGLSLHITRVHLIERRPFDPDKARAAAADAAFDQGKGPGRISTMRIGSAA